MGDELRPGSYWRDTSGDCGRLFQPGNTCTLPRYHDDDCCHLVHPNTEVPARIEIVGDKLDGATVEWPRTRLPWMPEEKIALTVFEPDLHSTMQAEVWLTRQQARRIGLFLVEAAEALDGPR